MALNEGSRTPWGKADYIENIAPGIQRVGTPSHGGYKLDRERNAQVNARWRREGGWYEEDCEWAIVFLTFESTFQETASTEHVFRTDLENAHRAARGYYPDEYTAVTGTRVTLEQSHVLRRRKFEAENRDNYVAVSGWGDWHPKVPAGFVGVLARKGGVAVQGERWFLIPKADYDNKGELGIVIRPDHQEWSDHA
jgi:hypothetical protein